MIGSGDNIRTMVSNFGISAAEKSAGSRYNSVLADQEREVFSVHERLHESVVTCMAASEDGMFLFTGSADCRYVFVYICIRFDKWMGGWMDNL